MLPKNVGLGQGGEEAAVVVAGAHDGILAIAEVGVVDDCFGTLDKW